ncbi:acyl transferase domain-containing protein [Saccharothrix carnea]|uniref:Acyl transferase domain-containing protein n=1 Tax=Saccharothrix carnea TaxID=1280637 RepID=A0A2P8I2I0_SACCR|nr:type I polyketide synthase [Saccharothrix carnea]PSL52666.1 acyl transferase domain-containing protein [Saccharothrix carnea]
MVPNPGGTTDAYDGEASTGRTVPLEPVALVGIGCRFPGGVEDPEGFWDLIASGTDAIGDIPPDRWRADAFYDADPATPGRMTVRQGGFLRHPVDRFDAGFFGLPPREAAALDPQQRLLLEVAWEAFEDAGIPLATTAGRAVGAYIGGFTFDAATHQLSDANRHLVGTATPTGVSMTMLAARLSYAFDWHGPSLTLDTACSSSLVAFHHACAALSRGECDVAVAGGVNVMVNPVTTILMSKGQFLSPDGRCKSFDHRANGYARAEGAAVVVLKSLAAAERDGDRVYAVVRGTAVNQDGRTPGITVPSARAQREVIRQACRSGGVEPASVGYYEAHGTGTAVGDPIEATAIGEVLGGSDRTHWIGSVKSNIGHSEAAAGVAGVIKAALCLERGLIPPNLHFERPNPRIPFDRLPLRVPTELVPFPGFPGPRRAGVNSFGFGGTNAHAILEQAPPALTATDEKNDGRAHVLPLSARSPEALRALAARYAELLARPDAPTLRRVGRAAARQRDHHPVRASVVAVDAAGAVEQLRKLEPAPRRATRGGVAFVYTGMGPQWWGMGRELLTTEPRFAEVVAECDAVLARFGLSIGEELLRDEDDSRLTETLYAQVANFVVQAGLTALWRAWGVEPSVVVGHSVGEVAAAHAAGVYSLQDALTVAFHRAHLQAGLAGRAAMAAVDLAADDVRPYLVDGVEVAAVNSATATTLAGDRDAVEEVSRRLRAAGASVKPLRVEVAYHSRHMDVIREPLLAALHGIEPREARVPLVSTVTGDRVTGAELDAAYWWENVRRPVRFAAALRRVLSSAPGAVVEIGPHPALAAAIDEGLSAHGDVVRLASLRRDRPQRQQLLEALGALYAAGIEPDWEGVHPGPREHLDLPRYPWQRERHWVESSAAREARLGGVGPRPAGRTVSAATPTRDVELSESEFPYLADHRIGDTVVFPGSGYLEAALALFPDDEPCFFEDVVFQRPLALEARSVTTLRVSHDPAHHLVTLHSRGQGDDAGWTPHGRMRRPDVVRPRAPRRRTETLEQSTRSLPEVGRDEVYALLDRSNLTYGPAFRGVERLWWREGTGEVFAELRVDAVDATGHRLHPALLDAALQAVIAGSLRLSGEEGTTYVPARIAEFRFHRSPGRALWLHGRDRGATAPGRLECDLTLVTDDGEVVAEVIGLRAQRLVQDGGPTRPEGLHYEHTWRAEPLERTGGAEGRWVVIGSSPVCADLAAGLTARGGDVVRTSPEDENWLDLVRNATGGPCRGVVLVNGPDRDDTAACGSVAAPLRLVQTLADAAAPLFLVTSGAQSATADDHTVDPFAAALWGFGRVVGAERPDLRCRLVDITPETGAGALVDELTHPGLDEVVLRGAARYVRRLERAGDRSPLHHVTTRAGTTPVRLRANGSGVDGLGFTAADRRAPGPTEVEVEVSFVGLNFKDVLKVTGLLTPEAVEGSLSREKLGLECSGTVVRVGDAVADLRPGDEVFVHGADLFASHVTVDAVRVVRKPSTLSLAQAASLLPVVTAHQALVRLARVRPGERVLVHSAAGGVGLAAVRIASRLGAEVYATAGSDERREFLRREGVAGVSDSRSTDFADDVLRRTGGEGVDVVVNSLSGELLRKSLGLLRPFGRFVELGKVDIAADHALGLAPFHRALSFHAFDYDRMMLLDPELVRASMLDVAALHEDGAVDPLPVTEVPAGQVEAAFRAMTRADHVGKVVVRVAGEPVAVPASSVPGSPIRSDGTYLVTGGLGGLGLAVAGWLADRGARHLVLVGRRGIVTADAERVVAELTGRGVEVRVERVDVADRAAVERTFALLREQLPPVRGVVHAAADFDDVVLADTDGDRLITATRPKADGAWHLHLATHADDLDFFVLFSSVAAQLGAAAAGAYATANEFLNALARHRRLKGLPATAVGWGMVDEVGVAVRRDGAVGDALRRNGHVGMSPARLVAELEALLRTRPVELSVADVDWARWARANPQLARLPRYESLVPAEAADGGGHASVTQRLRDASPVDRLALLSELVTPLLHRTTGLTGRQLADEQAVDIDSLVAVELRVGLQNALGVSVPAVKLQRNLTVSGLAGLLAEELDRAPGTPSRPAEAITAHGFTAADGLVVHGHLSLPDGPGPHPAVVVCTAGEGGALDDQGRYARVSEHAPLLAAGFAVFTVDQRGAPGHGAEYRASAEMGGRDIDDVVAAAHHLAGLPGIDPARVSILGTSRGAYSALLALAQEPSRWHRAVLLMGLYDPTVLVDAERSRPGTLLPRRVGADEVATYFADPARQPLARLGDVRTPLLLVHGDADEVVPVTQAVDLVERARRLDLPARLVTVPGLGHDHDHADEAWTTLWPRVADFLGEVSR